MPEAHEMMAECLRFRSGAYNEYVSGAHTAFEAPIDQHAINQPAQAERDRHQPHCDQHDASGYVRRMNQIESAGQQKTRGEAGLHVQPLLMQKACQTRWQYRCKRRLVIMSEIVNPQKRARRMPIDRPLNERAVPEPHGSGHRPGMQLVQRRECSGPKDGYSIQNHP